MVYDTLEALGVDTGDKNRIIEVHNKIDVSVRKRFPPFLKGLEKDKIFSISAKKRQGLENLFQGIENKLYKKIIKENVILGVNETEKIKWLYQNQLVKSSELKESDIKLELIWDGEERQKFNETFAVSVL
mgnify:CR=1 FL=1